MFDYQIKINDYLNTKDIIKDMELEEIILAYLSECECPFLVELKNERKNNGE